MSHLANHEQSFAAAENETNLHCAHERHLATQLSALVSTQLPRTSDGRQCTPSPTAVVAQKPGRHVSSSGESSIPVAVGW